MDMNGIHAALQQEAARRNMGLGGSSAGVGAPVANSQSAGNPINQQTPPLAEDMYKGAIGMVQKAKPNEVDKILQALIKRLHQNPVQGQPVQ